MEPAKPLTTLESYLIEISTIYLKSFKVFCSKTQTRQNKTDYLDLFSPFLLQINMDNNVTTPPQVSLSLIYILIILY